MHKEELIELHKIFYDIKEYLESINPNIKFPQYTALEIQPEQINRSKLEHKYAIFILGSEIAASMKGFETISSRGLSTRMKELAEKTLKEIESEHEHQ
ncbi:MAG TPA: UPF0058 family protein [Methanocorpusculum sp.]|nr:UPF0058 family protein [Methanocorpusculum sp.]HJK00907.1 UPF0058 family protein [Methanocorpusculum sp.]HJK02075.1 UPF0058 family protein [Methanocorpusculum sp.]